MILIAVTELRPVKSKPGSTLDYIMDESKTLLSENSGSMDPSVSASDGENTTVAEQKLVTGINCSTLFAKQEMKAVPERFGNRGEIALWHGIQSFAEGEVDPKKAHEIGVELARKMWGNDHQVVMATHLKTNCIHNHFAVNAYSFRDGTKVPSRRSEYLKFRELSDEVCRREHLSVLEDSGFLQGQSNRAYWYSRTRRPDQLKPIREDILYCLRYSASWNEFDAHLSAKGYGEQGWDKLEITSIGWDYSIPVEELGIPSETVFQMVQRDDPKVWEECDAHPPMTKKGYLLLQVLLDEGQTGNREAVFGKTRPDLLTDQRDPVSELMDRTYMRFKDRKKEELVPGAVYGIIERLYERAEGSRDEILYPDLRHALTEQNGFSGDRRFLTENRLHTVSALKKDIKECRTRIRELEREGDRLYRKIRRSKDPEQKAEYQKERNELKQELTEKRQRVRTEKGILKKTPWLHYLLKGEALYEQEYLGRERNRSRKKTRDLER